MEVLYSATEKIKKIPLSGTPPAEWVGSYLSSLGIGGLYPPFRDLTDKNGDCK